MRALLLLALAASAARGATPPQRPTGLILISVDDLRADRLSARRDGRPVTPRLAAFASESEAFDQAVSQAPWTLPSMMTVFTSVEPHRHGVTNRFAVFEADRRELARLDAGFVTLAETLQKAGFETAAFTGDAGLDGAFGFSRGFGVYGDSTPFAGFVATIPPALDWLRGRGGRPFFLFLHGYDVHGQGPRPARARFALPDGGWPSAESFMELRRRTIEGDRPAASTDSARALTALYDERAAAADALVGSFLDEARRIPGLWDRTAVVVMADHGEELLEHGGADHGMALYDESLRVPLLMRVPGRKPARVREQVRLMDVMPTALDLLGVSDARARAQMRGVSLVPAMEGRKLSLDSVAETDFLFRSSARSLRTADGYKIILNLETLDVEVYDLAADPGETRNLAAERPDLREKLEQRLRAALEVPR